MSFIRTLASLLSHSRNGMQGLPVIPASAGIHAYFYQEIFVNHALIFLLLFIPSVLSAQVLGGSYRTLNGASGGSLEFGGKPNEKLLATAQGQYFEDRWGVALIFSGGTRRVHIGVLAGLVSSAPAQISYAHSSISRAQTRTQNFNFGAAGRFGITSDTSSAMLALDYGYYTGFGIGLLFPF